MIRPVSSTVLAAGALLASLALGDVAPVEAATWKWRDASGRIVYSDLPPPAGARVTVLASPAGSPTGVSSTAPAALPAAAGQASGAPVAANPAAAPPAAASPPPAPVGWVEREKASRAKALERAETERKQADEQRQAAERARECDEARTGLRTLESGIRLQSVDARGETVYIDEAERARRIEQIRRSIAEHCGDKG